MYNYPKYQSYEQTYDTGYSNKNFLNKLKEYANRQRYYDTMYGGWHGIGWKNNIMRTLTPDYDNFLKPNNMTEQGIKYAQNNYSGVVADTSYYDTYDRNVDYYFNRDKNDLCENEGGFIPYAYLDTAKPPKTTIGCGINIEDIPNVQLYHAQTGNILSDEELQSEMEKLKESYLHNGKPSFYENKSNIRIAQEENDRIMKMLYTQGYNHMLSKYPDYHSYTQGRQKYLMDMIYNLGQPKFDKYVNMRDAILQNNWKQAANEAWRCGVDFGRNKRTLDNMYPGLNVYEISKEHCNYD
ncbi:MAG: hypothetical protein IJ019_00420 [Alphaproteobacteria bacterium]|nr:hypothetical protein [Alphaproteobacteria bacterium]